MAATATTVRPDGVRPLHRPAEVARLLGCSEWWVKEQARQRRIPYTWIGGSYRFTDEHVTEIVRRFEVAPLSDVPATTSGNAKPKPPQTVVAGATLLVARPPRRPRRQREPGSQVS